jgi:methylenetetrahydrofolate dehydrogenase (NADP+)/methenyltetrahydrofolate cyclohydrolase
MILLDGKSLSEKILSDLRLKIENCRLSAEGGSAFGGKINLDIVLVGDDPSSIKYIALKQNRASGIGIGGQLYHFPSTISQNKIFDLFTQLNNNSNTTGYFIQLPIPNIRDYSSLLNNIIPHKDVDGLNPNSGVTPAVARGIISLLNYYQISFNQKNIVIINDSNLIGQPLKKYFSKFSSQIFLLNDQTLDLTSFTKNADILISATGVKNLITTNMLKKEVVVVDVGGGDVDFKSVSKIASFITPTFGGVGPMTVASLLQNTYDLAVK